MKPLFSFSQDFLTGDIDTFSPSSLIQNGLHCLQQGCHSEGLIFFHLARERLSQRDEHLIEILTALEKCTLEYIHAHQTFHAASKSFAASTSEQEKYIALLQQLLLSQEQISDPLPDVLPRDTGRATRTLYTLSPIASEEVGERPPPDVPPLYVTCFNRFEVRRHAASGQPIELCRNLKGQAILRYLVAQPRHTETVDRLMERIWPEERSTTALHKLHVAVSALRRSLNKGIVEENGRGYILYEHQTYQINPEIRLQSDVDQFVALYKTGLRAKEPEIAIIYYEQACALHTGPFLMEDLYVDWSFIRREEIDKMYMTMCDTLAECAFARQDYPAAITWASAILKIDRCDEAAHRQLIRAYFANGQRNQGVRQYQHCQRVLQQELGIEPTSATNQLFTLLVDS